MADISIIVPAHNESGAIAQTIQLINDAFRETPHAFELIVVDDGSSDETAQIAKEEGARVLRHPLNIGYGNAILTGVRAAQKEWIGITDADGTYPIDQLPLMLEEAESRSLDMLVGARQGKHYHGSSIKKSARIALKLLTEFVVGRKIPDVNSGLRVMRREMILRFAPVLSGGFSFTTTITIIAFLTYHFVDYHPIPYASRKGQSKVRFFRDTLRAAQIIVMTILLFNPIKIFILLALPFLGIGLILFLIALLVGQVFAGVLVLFFFLLGAAHLMALGLLAEQQRVNIYKVAMRQEKSDSHGELGA